MLFIRQNVLAILWSIIIIVLCSIPGQEFPDTSFLDIPHLDKIIHFGLYFILSIVTIKGFYLQDKINIIARFPFISTIAYTVSLGIIIELLQHFYINFRQGDIYDVFANAGGSFIGFLLVFNRLVPKFFLLGN